MRVLLADAHPKVRWALRTFIEEEPGLTIVGEVSEADALLSQALTLRPDLILLEWELRDGLVSDLRALDLPARVIALGWRPESERDAFAAGADGFVSKVNGPEKLLAVLRRVMRT